MQILSRTEKADLNSNLFETIEDKAWFEYENALHKLIETSQEIIDIVVKYRTVFPNSINTIKYLEELQSDCRAVMEYHDSR